jgi:hypothetical protein
LGAVLLVLLLVVMAGGPATRPLPLAVPT